MWRTRIQRLGLPDGAVTHQVPELTDTLSRLLRPDDLCLTPWRSDGHPDHEATGSATIAAARRMCTPFLEYLVWTWHWTTPGSGCIPWSQCHGLDLGRRQTARKRWATYAYTSQVRPRGDGAGPILADSVLRRFWRPFEVFIEAGFMTSTGRSYFEEMYRDSDDPWEFGTSPYEQRKYAVTVASLPRARYRSAYEPGCSIGVLTELLATRCDRLLSSDIIPSALQQAEARLRRKSHVWLEERSIPEAVAVWSIRPRRPQ